MSQLIFKEPEKSFVQKLRDLFTPTPKTITTTKTITDTTISTITRYNEPQGILYPMRDVITTKVVGGLDSYDYERARKYARFAAHSYPGAFSNNILPYNCKVIERHQKNNGLRATLYMVDEEIICAFAGTEASNIRDWEANFTQLVGGSQQYEDALKYGRSVCRRYPSREIVFVGHSKGGGEAAYCAYNLGKQAETFNPAGLSILTKYVTGSVRDDAEVNAYVFSTDVLNNLQNAIGGGVLIGADGNKNLIATLNIPKYGIHGVKGILKYFDII